VLDLQLGSVLFYSVSSYGTPGRFFHSKNPDSRPTQSPSTTIENPKPAIDPEKIDILTRNNSVFIPYLPAVYVAWK